MKKLLILTVSLIFVLAVGSAYAESLNGVSDFSGLTYDNSAWAVPGESGTLIEGSGAGGFRDSAEITNGVSDFSGQTYDYVSLVGGPAESTDEMIESSGAGGLRDSSEGISNSVTDFSGHTYDK